MITEKPGLDVNTLEDRKRKEIEFHDRVRSVLQGYERSIDTHESEQSPDNLIRDQGAFAHLWSNAKYYSITRESEKRQKEWMQEHCISGKRVLDFACGSGENAILAAQCGSTAIGIDLSAEGVRNARLNAERGGVAERCSFQQMDGEHMTFPDAYFDAAVEYGALHHVELDAAAGELARVLKPEGKMLCIEALRHNPIVHWYRRLTPHLRTEWEVDHILGIESLDILRRHFQDVSVTFFHLAVLAAVPLRKTRLFHPVRTALEKIDHLLLRSPGIGKYGWIMLIELGRPRRAQR